MSLLNHQNQTTMSPPQPSPLEPKIWRACAGAAVQFPILNSRVYYFPQGHMDQASSLPQNLSPLLLSRPYILSTVTSVQFLADPNTDEVFVKLVLHPIVDFAAVSPLPSVPVVDDGDSITSFTKILTPSDANNGGGFSVPRFCAESIFPLLDLEADKPSQTLMITDVHSKTWEFRHIYRGTPKRHLLTTGWGKFVNSKNLIAGDSVVFMKNSRKQMFIGIRRANRFAQLGNNGDGRRYYCAIGGVRKRTEEEKQEESCKEGFSRNGKGKLSPESVAEAAELAAQNLPFEVVYYPRAGWSDFVVKSEVVDIAMSVVWSPGMRVKMAVETDDSSRMTWFQGTVTSRSVSDNSLWRCSPWRMLQITWDDPIVLQNSKWVSPWQVELVSTFIPTLPAGYSPLTKKFRAVDGYGMSSDRGGDLFSMTGYTNSTMGPLKQTFLNYGTFPAGMQGARHDPFSSSSFSNFLGGDSHLCMGNSSGNNTVPRLKTLSTELTVGSSQSDGLSPESQSSLPSFGTELVLNHSCNSTKPGSVSFQLFGSIIQLEQTVETGSHGTGCIGSDNIKGCNETESDYNPLDGSLSYLKLLDRPDDQCQRDSTEETYYS